MGFTNIINVVHYGRRRFLYCFLGFSTLGLPFCCCGCVSEVSILLFFLFFAQMHSVSRASSSSSVWYSTVTFSSVFPFYLWIFFVQFFIHYQVGILVGHGIYFFSLSWFPVLYSIPGWFALTPPPSTLLFVDKRQFLYFISHRNLCIESRDNLNDLDKVARQHSSNIFLNYSYKHYMDNSF